ncbi:hypothetical protein SODALDRAFT_357184 [Sodiomyces alkalinus F11]|uniref:Uncharacterized protein n=1 Tax=Sodiomyces alkalinus (strain CBS 110278 / VKM F-3762 / F11) TaxID=1314773 RepID=A0A3N2Q3F4_SODAK|nr:hypothetical protein SODALDRAFT_357184 [Sodiomyces alkalinus F11]ROT41155.1 hypothetical protein SODALDRAFT_357184 [Sodiomyces alkalinus F11]
MLHYYFLGFTRKLDPGILFHVATWFAWFLLTSPENTSSIDVLQVCTHGVWEPFFSGPLRPFAIPRRSSDFVNWGPLAGKSREGFPAHCMSPRVVLLPPRPLGASSSATRRSFLSFRPSSQCSVLLALRLVGVRKASPLLIPIPLLTVSIDFLVLAEVGSLPDSRINLA